MSMSATRATWLWPHARLPGLGPSLSSRPRFMPSQQLSLSSGDGRSCPRLSKLALGVLGPRDGVGGGYHRVVYRTSLPRQLRPNPQSWVIFPVQPTHECKTLERATPREGKRSTADKEKQRTSKREQIAATDHETCSKHLDRRASPQETVLTWIPRTLPVWMGHPVTPVP